MCNRNPITAISADKYVYVDAAGWKEFERISIVPSKQRLREFIGITRVRLARDTSYITKCRRKRSISMFLLDRTCTKMRLVRDPVGQSLLFRYCSEIFAEEDEKRNGRILGLHRAIYKLFVSSFYPTVILL